jgi:hypothetical protein
MEKKLQDYLHYYLHGKIWEAGITTCTLIGIGDCYYTIKTKQGTLLTLSNRANIKLVLRRLEDMTEAEKLAIVKCYYYDYARIEVGVYLHGQQALLYKGAFKNKEFKHYTICFNKLNSLQFHFLISQGFDLFGLIPAGIALDAKTITL